MPRHLILFAMLACLGAGCAHRDAPAAWVRVNGGAIANVTYQDRADRVRLRLVSPAISRLRVLGSSEPAAYSWPGGEVFVTRGLLKLLDDDELAAAIAHEIGHLTGSDRHAGVVGLKGRQEGVHAEMCADDVGARLLRGARIPPQTMATMLSKVRNAARLRPVYAADMDRRIERLRQTFGAASH